MTFKVLIADDDAGMRLMLNKLIEKYEDFEIAGEAENGEEALRLAEELRPQIIFMDVEMPVLNGVDCAKKVLDINPKTMIIFATAHEEYMTEAFELYAFDYMIKPFKIDRVKQTLHRIKELYRPAASTVKENTAVKHSKVLDKLIIRNKDGISFVDMSDIILIQREDRSTVVYTAHDRYVTSEGMSEVEEKLDRALFFRSHKSYIINLSMIHKIYPYGRWTFIVKLKNTDRDALMTHDKYEELQEIFK